MNRLVTLLVVSACTTNSPDPIASPDGGSGSGSGSGVASCDPHLTQLHPGSPVTVNSTSTGGNPQRDYCITVPGAQIRLDLNGGDCGQFQCIGDDVKMYLKRGDVPDAFDPDSSTTEWTYTPDPNGFGMYVKAAQAGAWYLGIIDDQNTLGYRDVALEVSFP